MAYVPPEYPGDIPEFAEVWPPVDDVNWMYTSAWDALVKEVRAIMTELGIDPAGAFDTVVARLDAAGVGDVVGPGAALDEAIVRYNGTSGKLIQATLGAKIDDTGRLTNTAQPAFSVYNSAGQNNIATGSEVTIVLDLEIFDVGNNFAANIFTAPVTGKYQLNVIVNPTNIDTDGIVYFIRLNTSNRNYRIDLDPSKFTADLTQPFPIPYSMVADMDANDTAFLQFYQDAGAAQTDIEALRAYFSGALLS